MSESVVLETETPVVKPRTSTRRRKHTSTTASTARHHEYVRPVLVTVTRETPDPEVETPDQTSCDECLTETTNVASVIPPSAESPIVDETQDTTLSTAEVKAEAQENNVVDDTTNAVDTVVTTTESQTTGPVVDSEPKSRRFAPIMALEDILPVDQCTTNPTTGNDNDTTIDDTIQEFIDRVVEPILHSVSPSPSPSVLSCSQRCKTLVLTLTMDQRARLYQRICERILSTSLNPNGVSPTCLQKLDGVCFWLHTHYTNLSHIQKPCFSSL